MKRASPKDDVDAAVDRAADNAARLLLDGYRRAIRAVESADMATKALVVDAVVTSARSAADRLRTRVASSASLAAEFSQFADSLAPENRVRGLAGSAAKWPLAHMALLAGGAATLGAALLTTLTRLSRGTSDVALILGLYVVAFICLSAARNGLKRVSSALVVAKSAREVLATTVDARERELYATWGGSPPSRLTIDATGPVAGATLALVTIAFAIVGLVAGAAYVTNAPNAGRQPRPTPNLDRILGTPGAISFPPARSFNIRDYLPSPTP